jgi:hypothetical protein
MTRNEAIKIMSQIWGGNRQYDLANSYVDAFIALGMLKLDEPEKSSPEATLCDILYHQGLRGLAQRSVLDAITSAGLKVVHRSPQDSQT